MSVIFHTFAEKPLVDRFARNWHSGSSSGHK